MEDGEGGCRMFPVLKYVLIFVLESIFLMPDVFHSSVHINKTDKPLLVALPDRLASSIQFFVEECQFGLSLLSLITKIE